jgi:PAS domain S-box-containing protein
VAEGPKIPAETLQFLVDSAPDGVAILVRGVVVFINPRGAELLGAASPEAVLGTPIAQYMPPEDARLTAERIGAMFRTGVEQPPNEYSVVADPSRTVEIKSIVCRWEGQPAVLAFARDVSDRKAIQQKLVEADRLTALGTLAAGVAHEINNPLTYVELGLHRIEQATRGHAVAAEVRELLADVEHGVARIATITRSLRTFARSDDAPPSPVDVRAVLERALQMLDNQLRHEAIVACDLADAPAIFGNASKLEQVFVNLLNNARHALAGEPRRIDVGLVTQGDTVVVTVRDTGTGIPAAIRHRVFEPFFTTRAVGDGMGLGLPVCKSIVESLGGTIEIDSIEGAGTTVRVTLRAYRDAAAAVPTPDAPPPRTAARRRVLLVDDDALVRHAVARSLEPHHEVTSVDGGRAALAALATSSFDAILCDVMMPGMSGRELFERVAELHPGLERRLVFITGGTFAADLDAFLVSSGNRCLTKPFRMNELLEAIERLAGP